VTTQGEIETRFRCEKEPRQTQYKEVSGEYFEAYGRIQENRMCKKANEVMGKQALSQDIGEGQDTEHDHQC
jgi:hypothetical protein